MTPSEAIKILIERNSFANQTAGVAAMLGVTEGYIKEIVNGDAVPGPRLWRDIQRELEEK